MDLSGFEELCGDMSKRVKQCPEGGNIKPVDIKSTTPRPECWYVEHNPTGFTIRVQTPTHKNL